MPSCTNPKWTSHCFMPAISRSTFSTEPADDRLATRPLRRETSSASRPTVAK
jgi:hypothetical protein